MKLPRRNFLRLAAGAAALPGMSPIARALKKTLSRKVMTSGAFASFLLFSPTEGSVATAAEIHFSYANALRPAIAALLPEFERSRGHKLIIYTNSVGAVADRLQKGEPADVGIVTGPQVDDLQKLGRIVAGSRVEIAKIGAGMGVQKGKAKPDISSVEAFKRSMLAAKSIAYSDPSTGSAVGNYLPSLFERLGIAAELKPKTKLFASGGPLYEAVSRGEVEIGFGQISDVVATQGMDFVGPLPAAIQNYTVFTAAIMVTSKEVAAGKALIEFLISPATVAVLKTKGFE